ncbi:MAG TPA: class I tRNA ligase family protein, partial [Spirochaetia bacterium]|nr:class I tRNA ligase family protein [Spirochaetia bacterium]
TRPELLPACVGVTAHPEDGRYKGLFGKRAVTPLFRVPVPIFPSELADPEKGTGILMVCTFGDATDVEWWRKESLALRQILSADGTLIPVRFGSEGWPSLKPEEANANYGQIAGKKIKAAQKVIVELLRDPAGSAVSGDSAPLRSEPENISHPVKFYEKGDRPLEFITTRQWFVRLLDKKSLLMQKGNQIAWYPDYMRRRFLDWTENLQFDWCISRQRYFGVPFPVWFPIDGRGNSEYDRPILAEAERLPVDPMTQVPPSYREEQRGAPGGFVGESDVFDTWFTSSLSPQIGSHWLLDPERHRKLFPMDLRPQSHEIIRTWAFYTITKAALHEDAIPWKNVVISGWVLDPDRKKMSKSKGNVVTPMEYLETYTADGVRYWASSARLGTDTAFDEKVLKVGKRLVTKIFNAGKFVLSQTAEYSPPSSALDLAFVQMLGDLVERVSRSFEAFDFAGALMETEGFFWNSFTDTYIELVKNRAKDDGPGREKERSSAVAGLRLGLNVLLRLFAPVLPYITEEVWSWAFAEETGWPSVHTAPWPGEGELKDFRQAGGTECIEVAVACLGMIHKYKTLSGVSVGREFANLRIGTNPETLPLIRTVLEDVKAAARAEECEVFGDPGIEKQQFEIQGQFKERSL